MKRLAFALALLLWSGPAMAITPLTFDTCTQFYWSTAQDKIHDRTDAPIYLSLGTAQPFIPGSINMWITTDLTPWGVPVSAKFVFLSGLLIITHGTTAQSADIRMTFAAPYDATADPTTYIWQTSEGNIGGGQRTDAYAVVPAQNGQIKWAYYVAAPYGWPTYSSYGVNVSIDGYCQ